MQIIDRAVIEALQQKALTVPRLRTNLNLHDSFLDPIQKILNANQMGTYIPPHRHPEGVWELFIVLAGSCAILTFDEQGIVTQRAEMAPGGTVIVEVPSNAWHCLVISSPDTIIMEVKKGPYDPALARTIAPWAADENTPQAPAVRDWLMTAQVGQIYPG